MNRAAHGIDVDEAKAEETIQVGRQFLAEFAKSKQGKAGQ